MNKKRTVAYILTIVSMFIWGLSYIWVEQVYEFLTPITTVMMRVCIATIFLVTISITLRKLQKIKRQHFYFFMLMGLLDPLGYFILEALGLANSSAATASVVISLIPVLLPIAAFFVLKEKIAKTVVAGVLLSFTGVLFVIMKPDLTFEVSTLGILFLLLAVFASVTYNILLKKLLDHYNIFTIITTLNIVSTFYFIPIFFFYSKPEFSSALLTWKFITPVLLLAFLASTLSFLFYAKGIEILGVSKTNVFANLIPVITAFFAWLILDEEISVKMMIGIALVICGLFIANLKIRPLLNRYGRKFSKESAEKQ